MSFVKGLLGRKDRLMPKGHGTYDSADPEDIRSATMDAHAQYALMRYRETVFEGDILVAIATALNNEYD